MPMNMVSINQRKMTGSGRIRRSGALLDDTVEDTETEPDDILTTLNYESMHG